MNLWMTGVIAATIGTLALVDYYVWEAALLIAVGKYLMDIVNWMAFWR